MRFQVSYDQFLYLYAYDGNHGRRIIIPAWLSADRADNRLSAFKNRPAELPAAPRRLKPTEKFADYTE